MSRRLLVHLLIAGHLLINCMWASAHMAKDAESGCDTRGMHVEIETHKHAEQDTEHHQQDHEEHAHVQLLLQVADFATLAATPHKPELTRKAMVDYLSIAVTPPVPPPNA